MEMDRHTKTASTHPHLPSTHIIPLLQKNPQLFGLKRGMEAGEGIVCIQLGYSNIKVQASGMVEFTLNGKRVYPVTSALVFPHVVISASLNLLTRFLFVLFTVSWPAFHFCLLTAVRLQSDSLSVLLLVIQSLPNIRVYYKAEMDIFMVPTCRNMLKCLVDIL